MESEIFQNKGFQNIIDYLYRYNDVSFTEMPFNDVDALVLSSFSYIPFEEFEKNGHEYEKKTIKELCVDYLSWLRLPFIINDYPVWLRSTIFLAMALLSGKRFSSSIVSAFYCKLSEKKHIQFGAINVLLSDQNVCCVFRGTDNTILGWKEDFYLACYENVFGQDLATEFLAQVMSESPKKKFKVMGHSKGGNFAVYSSTNIDPKFKNRITDIYSFDGPGLGANTFLSEGYRDIENKVKLFLVKDDLIGCLLNHKEPYCIVDSYPNDDFLMQHDPFHWKILGSDFVKVDRRSPESIYFATSVNGWLNDSLSNVEERIKLVDALFEMEKKTGYKDPHQILSDTNGFINSFVRSYRYNSKDEKALIKKALFSLIASFTKNYASYNKDKKEMIKIKALSFKAITESAKSKNKNEIIEVSDNGQEKYN